MIRAFLIALIFISASIEVEGEPTDFSSSPQPELVEVIEQVVEDVEIVEEIKTPKVIIDVLLVKTKNAEVNLDSFADFLEVEFLNATRNLVGLNVSMEYGNHDVMLIFTDSYIDGYRGILGKTNLGINMMLIHSNRTLYRLAGTSIHEIGHGMGLRDYEIPYYEGVVPDEQEVFVMSWYGSKKDDEYYNVFSECSLRFIEEFYIPNHQDGSMVGEYEGLGEGYLC